MGNEPFEHLYSREARTQQPSAIREICHLAGQPDIRSLAGGWPDPEILPNKETAEIFSELAKDDPACLLQYGTTEGLKDLKEQICSFYKDSEGLSLKCEELLIIHGAQQGMDLLSRILIEPGDIVFAGLPTYFGGTGAMQSRGAEIIGVPVDEDGLNVEQMKISLKELKAAKPEANIKGIYVIPNFQNPTGATLSLKRRKHLLALADEYDFLIFEDDPYGELRFEDQAIASLRKLDTKERVIHIRSLSKTFSPGVRVAWMTAEKSLIRKMVVSKQFVDSCTNSLGQHIASEFIKKGYLKKQIAKNIEFYSKKRDRVLELLDRHFPATVKYNRPSGGFFIFVHLPENISANDLLQKAKGQKVVFVSGSPFFIDHSGENTFRISYSQVSYEDMEAAVKVLGEILHKL